MVQDPNKNPYDDCWFRNCFHRDTDSSAAKRPRANRESSSASSSAAAAVAAAEESSTSDDDQGWFNVSCHHHHAQPSAAGSSSAAAEEESTSGHHAPSCDHQQVIRVVQQPRTLVPDVQICPSQPVRHQQFKARQILALIGREHGGPATTLGDGNCCMHACMGETLSKEVIMELRENVTRIMNECPLLRQDVLNSGRKTDLQKMKVGMP